MKSLIKPAFVLTVALIVLLEGGARLFFPQGVSGRFDYGYDPDAGFAENADGTVKLFRAGGRRFFPQSFSKERPPGTFRVFVIGDSIPRGPSLQASYAWLLGDELRKNWIPAEAFNLAVPGFGVRRCQIVLDRIIRYDPSLIILHVNYSNEYEDEREWRRTQEFKGWHPRHWLMKLFILRRLYEMKQEQVFWRLVPTEIRQRRAVNDADAEVAASMDAQKMREWSRQVERVTRESADLARRRHIPILLLTHCSVETNPSHGPQLNDFDMDGLGESLAGAGVYHLSMKEVFAGTPNFQSHFTDGSHMKQSGHLILAQAIFHKLQKERLLAGFTPGNLGKTAESK
ncbi:MAG: SGNH/GDSL hydrolase family protein [Deltaproteobacteria bacterium]|nr:SGNH/GDSL hydrolase family protein [Deltaproteobacteria bacterium]